MPNHETDPKKQLELLAAHQQEFETLLHDLTGLTVKVSLTVHSVNNSEADLLDLFEAGVSLPDFMQESIANRFWIEHKDREISVFMPEDFNPDELYPEPEDLEGYAQAIETANADARRAEGQLKRNDDEIPF